MKASKKRLGIVITGLAIVSMSVGTWATVANAASAHSAQKAAQKHAGKAHAKAACKKVKPKGSVIYSDIQFPDTLNPVQTNSVVTVETTENMFLSPLIFNAAGKIIAQGATKVPTVKNGGVSKDGKTITIDLRHDLYWSNGKQETSADFKFGEQVYVNPASGPACASANICDLFARVDTPDKYTVVYHLKHAFAPFISNNDIPSSYPSFGWPGAWAKGDVVGAANTIFNKTTFTYEDPSYPTDGPYQPKEFVKDQRVTLQPMKYYRAITCGALLSSMVYIPYSDPAGMLADAANHNTDITQHYSFNDLSALHQQSKKVKLLITPGFFFEHLEFNMDSTYNGAPNVVHDLKVRQAMALAYDHVKQIVSANGISTSDAKNVAMYQILVYAPALHFAQPFADKSITGAWDPLANKGKGAYVTPGTKAAIADAKKLIAKSSCASGCTILFRSTGSPFRNADEAALASMWLPLGIKLDYQPVHNPPFYSNYSHGGTLQLGQYQVADIALVGGPDPSGYLGNINPKTCSRITHKDTDVNSTCAMDNRIYTSMTKAQNTNDPKVRQKYYNQWQEVMVKNCYWIPEYLRDNIGTSDGKVKPVSMAATQYSAEWNAYMWKLAK